MTERQAWAQLTRDVLRLGEDPAAELEEAAARHEPWALVLAARILRRRADKARAGCADREHWARARRLAAACVKGGRSVPRACIVPDELLELWLQEQLARSMPRHGDQDYVAITLEKGVLSWLLVGAPEKEAEEF